MEMITVVEVTETTFPEVVNLDDAQKSGWKRLE